MKNKSSSTSGVALVIVLGFLVLISALAVAFFSTVTTELKGARTFASGVSTRQLADSAVNIVQAQIRDATARENGAWASQPGMIRVYRDNNGTTSAPSKNAEAFFKLYSSDKMVLQTADLPAFVSSGTGDYEPNYASMPALWTDLNAPVVVRDPLTNADVPHFPVIDPRAVGVVAGFSFDPGKVNGAVSAGSDADRLPMPVRWIYVLKDGTLTVPSQGTGTKPTWPITSDGKMPTKDNPIVGRIAFWADDDCSKVNINTAAGFVNTPNEVPTDYQVDPNAYFGSYWDTPRFMTVFDHGLPDGLGLPKVGGPNGGLALTQLLQGEYQRYPGHPATTSLGGIFGAYMSSQDLWRILPRISTANYMNVSSASASAGTAVDPYSYGTNGGTQRVKVGPVAAGGGSDNQNLLPKTERLYASVDELLFATNPGKTAGQDPTSPTYMRQSNDAHINMNSPTKLTPDHLDRLRFFLTASSRAPELNLFGRPRVTIWPVRSELVTETTQQATLTTTQTPNVTTGGSIKYYPATIQSPDGGTGMNPYDKVMLFCSTIGSYNNTLGVRNSDQAPGSSSIQLPYRYIFFRRNPYLSTDITTPPAWPAAPSLAAEDQLADITLPRNRYLLETYLSRLTSQKIPGFGASLKSKWDVDLKPNRDQILAEIFDYCRCANAQDGTTIQFTPSVQPNRYFAPRGLMAPSKILFQEPIPTAGVPTQGRLGNVTSTGLGRFPTVYEASLVFYYAGPTWLKDSTLSKIVADKIEAPTDIGYDTNRHQPKYRQMRAFLMLSTFNPMFGYAPMAQPLATANTTFSNAAIEPRISYEIVGGVLDKFGVSTKNVPFVPGNLGFPAKDLTSNANLSTVMYAPSGSAWNGRNMGGFEGFMHLFLGGVNNNGVQVVKIRKADEGYNTFSNTASALPQQFFGTPPPGLPGLPTAGTVDPKNQEYYQFQTKLFPYTWTPPSGTPSTITAFTAETGLLIPTPDETFHFEGNTKDTPIQVKVWYDNYNPAGSAVNARPATIAGKPYTPVQTINLVFPKSEADWPVPRGDALNPDHAWAASAGNTEWNADFDPISNRALTNGKYYWNQNGSFAPAALTAGPSGYPKDTANPSIIFRDEFYYANNQANSNSPPVPMLTPNYLGTTPFASRTPLNALASVLEPCWSLASRINWASRTSDDPARPASASGGPPLAPYNWYGDRWRNIVQPGDTIRSIVYCEDMSGKHTTTATGDMRLGLVTDVNSELQPHPDYQTPGASRACSLRSGSANTYFGDTFYGQIVDPGNNKFIPNSPANLPYTTAVGSTAFGGNRGSSGVTGVVRVDSGPGDFDNGIGIFSDGPFANKEDEGNVVYAWWDQYNRVYHYPIPYFTDTWTYEKPGNTFTSPLRQLPSAVMFGSLPSAAASLRGWETLCFAPYPAGSNHPGNAEPKDHLLLDLFTMPVVEPYPISEPFSTAGKINMNYRIQPFDYIKRTTALRAALAPIRVTAVPKSDYATYKTGDTSQPKDPNTGNYQPLPKNYRSILDCNGTDPNANSLTLKAFDDYFDQGSTDPNAGMFKSASQICEMPLFGLNVTDINAYWSNGALTGDNVREKPYADLYPRLTTKSNTYTVHFRVQTLRQIPRGTTGNPSAYAVWEEGKDYVLGEYRGATTIERYIDPADTRFNQWTNTTGTINPDYINPDATLYDPSKDPATPTDKSNPTRSLELIYRFRTVLNKKFAP